MSLGNLAISDNWRRWETDRDAPADSVLPPPGRTLVLHRSRRSISSKAVPRRATRKFQKQSETCRRRDFAGTTSWQFHRLAQRELELIGESPFRVVGNRIGFNHALRSFGIDNKQRRLRQIAKVIDHDFLLFRIIQVKQEIVVDYLRNLAK